MAALAFSSSSASSTRAYPKFYRRSALPQLQPENQRICRQVGTRPEKKREPTGRGGLRRRPREVLRRANTRCSKPAAAPRLHRTPQRNGSQSALQGLCVAKLWPGRRRGCSRPPPYPPRRSRGCSRPSPPSLNRLLKGRRRRAPDRPCSRRIGQAAIGHSRIPTHRPTAPPLGRRPVG